MNPSPTTRVWHWRCFAAVLILGAAALRLWYLATFCELELSPDEAHYWDWSRKLDFSYYSKGPLVAYLIWLGRWLAGTWSMQTVGSEMVAVRLPAIVCGSLFLVSCYILTALTYRRESLAFALTAALLTVPLNSLGASLMTIDSPYVCCWSWALVFGYLAIFRQSASAWPALGLTVGFGLLAKYTMILWFPALGLFCLTSPQHRRLLTHPPAWSAVLIAAACCLPILYWNIQNDWVSFQHVRGQSGLTNQHQQWSWFGPLEYLSVQFGILLGFWFCIWLAAMLRYAPWKPVDSEKKYLWWMSAFVFCFFFSFSISTGGGQPNWPVAAYVSGAVLAIGWLVEKYRSAGGWGRLFLTSGAITTSMVGLSLTLVIHDTSLAYPLLRRIAGPPTKKNPMPVRKLEPTRSLRGWTQLARAVDARVRELRGQGIEPVVVAGNWRDASVAAFYCREVENVYCVQLALGGRHSQYDLWRPNPVLDPERFRGRTFVYIGHPDALYHHQPFEEVEPSQRVVHRVEGTPISRHDISVCHGFRGFADHFRGNKKY